jgi:hypothetical protein
MPIDFLEQVKEQLQKKVYDTQKINSSSGAVDLSDEAFPGLPTSDAPKPLASWKPIQKVPIGITERFEIPAHMLVRIFNQARQQLGKQTSVSSVCKEVMMKYKSNIEYSTNQKSKSMTFLVTGSVDSVKQSKKHLMNSLTVKVIFFLLSFPNLLWFLPQFVHILWENKVLY